MTERLHWGCGPILAAGFVNSDRVQQSPVAPEHLGDVLFGLPSTWTRRFDLVVTHHALQMMTAREAVDALSELRRVTKPGGWIRMSVPSIHSALLAFARWPESFLHELFPDSPTRGHALNRFLTHYGQRSYWTIDAMVHAVHEAGWTSDCVPPHGITRSPFPEAVELDGRPAESLYVEAVAP